MEFKQSLLAFTFSSFVLLVSGQTKYDDSNIG
jgi:hypothetical protein